MRSLSAASIEEAAPFLRDGNAALLKGSYLDAVRLFGEAFGAPSSIFLYDLDPSYVTLYKRATAYLSLGRNSAAVEDFDAILKLNPKFFKAYLEKAKVQAKEGQYSAATKSLKAFLASNPSDSAASELLDSVKSAEKSLISARKSFSKKHYEACISTTSSVIEVSPLLHEAREMRAGCYFGAGDVDNGIGELTRLATLDPSSADLAIKVSSLSYFLINTSPTLPQLKQCLHYDPDSKPCKKAFKELKALSKQVTQSTNFISGSSWRAALNILRGTANKPSLLTTFDELLAKYQESSFQGIFPPSVDLKKISSPRLALWEAACKAHVQLGEVKKAKDACEEVLLMDEESVDGLVGKAEGLLKDEEWEQAVRVLERAFEIGGRSNQDVANRLQKAQRLLKISRAKDYYKVLDVSRDADARTIKKAYRKAAKTAHPDKGGSEAKMAAVNEAYEVLSNPELKARFDNGDDPNDTSQPSGHGRGSPFAHHGGSPFEHFFHQQGGGGNPFEGQGGQKFHFKF
ncbi:dsRNA-activated protein kinase inhibitor P58, contains TPR and DnaJ domains [Phaffia rhodozyma]|uniref:DsRNA-activated protein kinase inhibitor P58, contains TPR and DnaJ domains n=1 Tax=Phaffia rhodozyma TaxID=264483 RepID=A0A0F7SVP3_PHARH|nr:dsRNA-activated protein kinase inhibitor P58, contains TPR and DnaJ domains [Phaffia rhodozyma]